MSDLKKEETHKLFVDLLGFILFSQIFLVFNLQMVAPIILIAFWTVTGIFEIGIDYYSGNYFSNVMILWLLGQFTSIIFLIVGQFCKIWKSLFLVVPVLVLVSCFLFLSMQSKVFYSFLSLVPALIFFCLLARAAFTHGSRRSL